MAPTHPPLLEPLDCFVILGNAGDRTPAPKGGGLQAPPRTTARTTALAVRREQGHDELLGDL